MIYMFFSVVNNYGEFSFEMMDIFQLRKLMNK